MCISRRGQTITLARPSAGCRRHRQGAWRSTSPPTNWNVQEPSSAGGAYWRAESRRRAQVSRDRHPRLDNALVDTVRVSVVLLHVKGDYERRAHKTICWMLAPASWRRLRGASVWHAPRCSRLRWHWRRSCSGLKGASPGPSRGRRAVFAVARPIQTAGCRRERHLAAHARRAAPFGGFSATPKELLTIVLAALVAIPRRPGRQAGRGAMAAAVLVAALIDLPILRARNQTTRSRAAPSSTGL